MQHLSQASFEGIILLTKIKMFVTTVNCEALSKIIWYILQSPQADQESIFK